MQVSSIASARETTEEMIASRTKITEDRNPQIDAAIVRVMKTRRVMDHNMLITEVTKQLQVCIYVCECIYVHFYR